MPAKVLYALVPTWVTSTRDNRRHYVPAHELIRLYKLPPGTYRVVGDSPSVPQAIERAKRAGLTVLYPDPTGKYALPGRDSTPVLSPPDVPAALPDGDDGGDTESHQHRKSRKGK